ncbi:hypothetical protein RO3G_00373 [Rhizopus delemar RA 99-880]|uniref:Uncharacterized protein n=1 Tax=Rhizopus delemar (strain RA 99-880 / ATCC MYA-4621 / FGSC 9543 / NRRL 43880) TaxID=246409 RepID=I1BHI9_RHIO9|nr:hypothetical protein RO3G_00373 [Rhizopus delemar RA 99-880]|eukprot:EIE75669.1 hypothetical protein RO3G_00373 [Rhizopus delemar RA 99-880]
MSEREVKAIFTLASSAAEEFKILLSFEARDLFGLLDMDNVGASSL